MTAQNEIHQLLHSKTLLKRALTGTGVALTLMTIFLLIVGGFDDGFWILIPTSAVTIAGALGGIFYDVVDHIRRQRNWNKLVVDIVCVLAYLAGLYMSLILALNFTGDWD